MKGFVFIYGKEIFLRFISTNAFRELNQQHQLVYVAIKSSSLLSKEGGVDESLEAIGLPKLEWVPFYPGRFAKWVELFDTSCALYKDRSTSFQTRYEEHIRKDPKKLTQLAKFATATSYRRYREEQEAEMGLHPDILEFTYRERPDFFVLPSALLDYCTDDVLQIAEKLKIPTIMLVSGWDNLSSKGILYHYPSAMGVWGEQNRRHAIDIQKILPERVFTIGAPHYDDFHPMNEVNKAELREEFGLPSQGKTLLFAGTFRLFDETQLLKEVDEAIENGQLPQMKILYRPHPWRLKRNSEEDFFKQTWRHIHMDPEIVKTYQAAKARRRQAKPDDFGTRMKHLIKIYQSVDAVISPMSTVLLEALLFGLPVQAVAFSDGKHSWSADKVSKMEHFNELFAIPNLLVSRKREDFIPQIKSLVDQSGRVDIQQALVESTQELMYRDGRSYAKRVADLVGHSLAKSEAKPAYDEIQLEPGKTYSPSVLQLFWRLTKQAFKKMWQLLKILKVQKDKSEHT